MISSVEDVVNKVEERSKCSGLAIKSYLTYFKKANKELRSLRFFSYGSNMNESKFMLDTGGLEKGFGLINRTKCTLRGYKRILGNHSENHGLAFTICPARGENVQGICHDIPVDKLESFLRKEGLFLSPPKSPSYELLLVSVSEEKSPVLTLKGLKPASIDSRTCLKKLRALCYVCVSIQGAKSLDVNCSDMDESKDQIEKAICGNIERCEKTK